jgi:hypothetical protein
MGAVLAVSSVARFLALSTLLAVCAATFLLFCLLIAAALLLFATILMLFATLLLLHLAAFLLLFHSLVTLSTYSGAAHESNGHQGA